MKSIYLCTVDDLTFDSVDDDADNRIVVTVDTCDWYAKAYAADVVIAESASPGTEH